MNVEEALREGLTATPKHIPFWYLYDKQGSVLFEKCWRHNQYHYMSKTEKLLIKEHVQVCALSVWEDRRSGFPTRSDTNQAVLLVTRWSETGNFGFRYCTIHVAKTKALISFAVTAMLICAFVFAYAKCLFSHDAAQLFIAHGISLIEMIFLYRELLRLTHDVEGQIALC